MDDISVSVICNTFNHEMYIKDALEGFVNQKTTFNYEVLIHDDASTDKTASIIRQYEKEYPNIIKPIYQTVNQYNSVDIIATYQMPRAKGKYIAFCEGDDYWTDCYKLQKQYDLMEKSQQYDMCAHKAEVIDGTSNEHRGFIRPKSQDAVLTTKEVIKNEGGYISTNSLFYKKSLFDSSYKFYEMMPMDYTMQIIGSLSNGIYYMDENMSVYRYRTANSWTAKMNQDFDKRIDFHKRVIKMLRSLNKETKYKYFGTVIFTQIKLILKVLYLKVRKMLR